MRNSVLVFVILLVFIIPLLGATSQEEMLPGFYSDYRVNEKGENVCYYYTFTGEKRIPQEPEYGKQFAARYSDTTVLWVDRNHLNAVAEHVSISGDGMTIFAGWWLNNERASLYRSLGDEFPVWFYSMPNSDWQIDVSSSEDGHLLAAASSGSPFRIWDKSCSIPNLTYNFPPGFKSGRCAVSGDGSMAAVAADNGVTGRLFVFNSDGDSLYAVDFNRGRGVYGVDLSTDGSIAVVSTYDVISVFENGSLRDEISNYGQTKAKVSGDGSRIVQGDFYADVTTYEWDGSNYVQMWKTDIGGPWVVAVDISTDGSTVMAGTGYSNGKSVMFDVSSSTPLWEYQEYGSYGAYVKAVSLSDDGSIGAAASWGDTAQTGSFYVLTVHSKNNSQPIIGITRDDEPGSLFDCDVSSDGENITAGGKAVHAYQMGNGGEVYSLLVGSTPSVNAATESIDSPQHLIQVGDNITPMATFTNYGDNSASFDVYISIEDSTQSEVYSSSNTVSNLAPGSSEQVVFNPDWSPSGYNYYKAIVWCQLSGDEYSGDDTLQLEIKCFHDAEVRSLPVPFDETTINMEVNPKAIVYNNGSYSEPFEGILTVRDSVGTIVYCDTNVSSSIPPETESSITFAPLTPSYIGDHTCDVQVNVGEDINPENDTTSKEIFVSYEIIYDDGKVDAFYIVGSTYDNNKFAVRYTPTLSTPLYFIGGRIYVNATEPFDYVQLCDDQGGLPDTTSPIREVYDVGASSAPDWAYFSFDSVEITTLRDYWLVLHWSESSPGSPGVGADSYSPTHRSWWYNYSSGWNNWSNHDWMVRLEQAPEGSGIEHTTSPDPTYRYYLFHCYPNPFSNLTHISFQIPENTKCSVDIFDISGRKVKTLNTSTLKPGHHTIKWNGKNNEGKRVASGIYFYRLKTKNYSRMKKLLFLK